MDAEFRVLPNIQNEAFSGSICDEAINGSSFAFADTAAVMVNHRIEVALERIEPAKLHFNNTLSLSVICEANLPDLSFANFNCMLMNCRDLASGRRYANGIR